MRVTAPKRQTERCRGEARKPTVGLFTACAVLASCSTTPRSPAREPVSGHRIAVAQYEIRGSVGGEDIIARVLALVRDAAAGGAELLVLPELFVLDAWPPPAESRDEAATTRRIAEEVTPVVWQALRKASRDSGVAISAGSAPEIRGDQLFNTARLFFPSGREERQDKVHLTSWGRRVGMSPGDGIRAFETPWGRTAILVCFDVEFPSISARLVARAPEVLLVPSMTESEAGRDRVGWTSRARAVEHHAYVVVSPTVGRPAKDWQHFGRASVFTPRTAGFSGLLARSTTDREGLTWATLDLEGLRRSRREADFFPARRERSEAPASSAPSRPGM